MRKHPPDGPRYGCCPVWAFARWWKKGGYIAIRQSIPAPWKPHFTHSTNGRYWWGYIPKKQRTGLVAVLDSLYFEGYIKRETMRPRLPAKRDWNDVIFGAIVFGGVGAVIGISAIVGNLIIYDVAPWLLAHGFAG